MKLRLTYRTLIHIATIYGVETWWLTVADEKDPYSIMHELIEGHENVRFMNEQRIK
jgi:hypothetical protein